MGVWQVEIPLSLYLSLVSGAVLVSVCDLCANEEVGDVTIDFLGIK